MAIVLCLGIYLNRSYAAFYDQIRKADLTPPPAPRVLTIENPSKKVLSESVKYVALGGSLTAGVGVKDYHSSYPYLAAQKLLTHSSKVTLVNRGIPGIESSGVLNDQVPQAIKEAPDYVSVMVGINDIHNLKSVSEYRDNMTKILEDLKTKTRAKITVLNNPPLGVENWSFPYAELLDLRTKQFNAALKEICQKEDVRYIDLYTATKTRFESSTSLYSPDLFHPNDQGYLYWSQFINLD